MATNRRRSRFSLASALALVATLGVGTAPAQMAAAASSPLKHAAMLDDRGARALTRKVWQHPAMGFTPRKDKGWLNGRGDWIGAKTMEKKRLEAAFGPLSGRQLNRLRKAKRRLANPAADLRTKRWAVRMVHNAARSRCCAPDGPHEPARLPAHRAGPRRGKRADLPEVRRSRGAVPPVVRAPGAARRNADAVRQQLIMLLPADRATAETTAALAVRLGYSVGYTRQLLELLRTDGRAACGTGGAQHEAGKTGRPAHAWWGCA